MFSSAVRTTLSACRGYECQEKDGIFMLAFADTGVCSATDWSCVLQLALLRVHCTFTLDTRINAHRMHTQPQHTVSAIEWSCVLQLALLRVHWAPELLASPLGAEVTDEAEEVVFRGLRSKIGLYKGEITRIIPHRCVFVCVLCVSWKYVCMLLGQGSVKIRGRCSGGCAPGSGCTRETVVLVPLLAAVF